MQARPSQKFQNLVFIGTLITIPEVDKQINISTNKTNYNNHEKGLYVLYVRILDAAMKIKIWHA